MDAVRGSLRSGALTLGDMVPSTAPPSVAAPRNALFVPAREPFWPAVAAECARLLDTEGWSERPVDRVLDERGARLLRRVLEAYGPRGPEHVARLHLAYDVPRPDDTARGRQPRELFGGQAMVMREVEAVRDIWTRLGSRTHLTCTLRWLAGHSLYQFQLVHELALACSDRASLYVVPLPAHVVAHQVAALRARYAVGTDEAVGKV
jgi:hypothetical protein